MFMLAKGMELKMNEEKIETKKINFFKRMYYSLTKPKKYDELLQDGIGKSIMYFIKLTCILSLLIGIASGFSSVASIYVLQLNEKIVNFTSSQFFIYKLIIFAFTYIVGLIRNYLFYILIVTLYAWLSSAIFKLKWGFKNSLMKTIYGSTMSATLYATYLIVNFFISIPAEIKEVFEFIAIFAIVLYDLILFMNEYRIKVMERMNKK